MSATEELRKLAKEFRGQHAKAELTIRQLQTQLAVAKRESEIWLGAALDTEYRADELERAGTP